MQILNNTLTQITEGSEEGELRARRHQALLHRTLWSSVLRELSVRIEGGTACVGTPMGRLTVRPTSGTIRTTGAGEVASRMTQCSWTLDVGPPHVGEGAGGGNMAGTGAAGGRGGEGHGPA